MRAVRAGVLIALAGVAAACGGSSPSGSASGSPPGVRTAPSIAAFLRQPVATPSVCPTTVSGSSVGRSSPWAGHVDVSIFLKPDAAQSTVTTLGRTLRQASPVETVYFESQAEAYAEFQRLYTCWARVPRSQTPASYRVVLEPTATIAERNALVARVLRNPAVDTASCDPTLPCTDVVNSASAAPTP